MEQISVALVGNPNSGKTTIFNVLTGSRQHVGNYPGVTVEHKEGRRRHGEHELRVTDLPGTYSLSAFSAEEMIARDHILEQKPDVVVDVIDASNLERNLYLAVQVRELNVPVVLAFNMSDTARARGYEFNLPQLSKRLGAPIVQTVGHKAKGIDELLDTIVAVAAGARKQRTHAAPPVTYGKGIDGEVAALANMIGSNGTNPGGHDPSWLALKLLEGDEDAARRVASPKVLDLARRSVSSIARRLGERPEATIAARRYEFISEVCHHAVRSTIEIPDSLSDRIDAVVTNRILGIPLFLGLMYLVFQLTFTLGEPPMEWIEAAFAVAGDAVSGWWAGSPDSLLRSLIVDGVIGGVGGVIVFLPNILLLFLAISILEDSGYMARVAFIMDRVMQKIGLHGKSFIPLIIGFGCSVPAIMATRTLENRRDRLATMLVVPLMSCGARLPIYALIIPAFFAESWHAPLLWAIYVIGIVLAIVAAKTLRSTVLKGPSVPFVMELPPYRMPTLRGVLTHVGERGWLYLRKAGTVILGISILLWAMTTFPRLPDEDSAAFDQQRHELLFASLPDAERETLLLDLDNTWSEAALAHSIAGRVGHAMEPLIRPMGFDWRIGTALIGAFAAKEVFVAQMGIVYSVGEADEGSATLRERLRENYTPLVGFSVMLFALISAPCMATIAITKRESNSWRWALFQLGGLTVLAYVVTVAVYQIGKLLGG